MSDQSIFIAMVFVIGFLMAQAFVRPLMGSSGKSRRRLRERIQALSTGAESQGHVSLVRDRYLEDASPLGRLLLRLPGMDALQTLLEQAGSARLPHQLVMSCATIAVAVAVVVGSTMGWGLGPLLMGLLAGAAPILWLKYQRGQRLGRFEEQLPDALTIAARSLRAGMPFNEALKLVSQELKEPAGKEFGIVFTEINYGGDVRAAFLGLLERVPSVAVMAMVTSVLVQRETGGNLAEVLDKLAAVVRQRFRFQRSVRTLTAEGRMSAWVMTLLPFGLAAAISILNPEYLPMMTQDPSGRKLIIAAFLLMVFGIFWMRRITNIDV